MTDLFWHFLTVFQSDIFDIYSILKIYWTCESYYRSGICPFSGMHIGFRIDSLNFLQCFMIIYFMRNFDFFCMFYRQDDVVNILELYVNHDNLFIKRWFHKDNNSTVWRTSKSVRFMLVDLMNFVGWFVWHLIRASFYRDQRNVIIITLLTIKFIFINSGWRNAPLLAPRNMNNWICPLTLLCQRVDLQVSKNRNSQNDVHDLYSSTA